MEEDLIACLLADAGLAALLGDRMTWNTRPQGSDLPALVLQLISASPSYTMQGRVRLVGHLVQFDVWGLTLAGVVAAKRALVAALDGLTVAPFSAAFIQNERGGFEAGDVVNLHRASLDVRVWHRSAT